MARLPPIPLLLAEPVRAFAELSTLSLAWPWLARAPRGDGHPVVLLPGLYATDAYMLPMRNFLRSRGHEVHAWGAGRNWGRWEALERVVVPLVQRLHAQHGRKVSLVGASMGGLYARAAAHRVPECVRCVVTLSSAVQREREGTYITPVYEAVTRESADTLAVGPAPVPCTSVFSRSDGLSDWRPVLLPAAPRQENVEVVASHLGMAWHPAVLYLVADRLGQAERGWQPFRAPAGAAWLYPQGHDRALEAAA
ncbi:MAG TPA: alpha/beta hydrolase-fold protein [Ramlibacter sp.]|jgi:pimeloyl-ACP methyl ester carboxylesterase|nr:alpha/beta hydrolase-fold protein [Ramlibacter sp.]